MRVGEPNTIPRKAPALPDGNPVAIFIWILLTPVVAVLSYLLKLIHRVVVVFFFSSRRRHTRYWSSDVCSSDLKVKKSKVNKRFNIVDFFCGAGGLSCGFSQEDFKVVLANDHDEECIETYKFNHPEISENKIILEDIKKIIPKLDKL